MSSNKMESEPTGSKASLDGLSVWLLTDGTAEQLGWRDDFLQALRARGASHAESVSVVGALGMTARNLFEIGSDRLKRELKIRRSQVGDVSAADELRSGSPDVIVIDGPSHTRAFQILRDALPIQPLLVSIVPDLALYHDWTQARPDGWILPSASMLPAMTASSVDGRYEIAGPPVAPEFLQSVDRQAVRREAGFDDDAFVCFIDVETMRPDTIDALVRTLSRSEAAVEFMIYFGRNSEAAEQMRLAAGRRGFRAHMFGFTPSLWRYVSMADVGVVGGGNRRLSGYLAMRLPMFSVDATHEQNAAVAEGAMVGLGEASQLRFVLEEVASEGIAEPHVDAVNALAERLGSEAAVQGLEALLARRDRLDPRELGRREAPPRAADAGSSSANPGPFEVIGDTRPGDAGTADVRTGPFSRAEAKAELARLIMEERRLEDEMVRVARERDRWLERQELASSDGDDELADYARRQLDEAFESLENLRETIESISAQKQEIRMAVAAGSSRSTGPSAVTPVGAKERSYEERFRQLEMKRDIDRLRRKAGRGDGTRGEGDS